MTDALTTLGLGVHADDAGAIDSRVLRSALGRFVTGVAIITTRLPDDTPVGLTVNSFSSVSLDPPLVLWSLDRRARTLPAFSAAGHFAVNILAADQVGLSQRFAGNEEDRFSGLTIHTKVTGAPLLPGAIGWFDCAMEREIDGGDHLIFLGRVLWCGTSDRAPLLYDRGAYALSRPYADSQ